MASTPGTTSTSAARTRRRPPSGSKDVAPSAAQHAGGQARIDLKLGGANIFIAPVAPVTASIRRRSRPTRPRSFRAHGQRHRCGGGRPQSQGSSHCRPPPCAGRRNASSAAPRRVDRAPGSQSHMTRRVGLSACSDRSNFRVGAKPRGLQRPHWALARNAVSQFQRQSKRLSPFYAKHTSTDPHAGADEAEQAGRNVEHERPHGAEGGALQQAPGVGEAVANQR